MEEVKWQWSDGEGDILLEEGREQRQKKSMLQNHIYEPKKIRRKSPSVCESSELRARRQLNDTLEQEHEKKKIAVNISLRPNVTNGTQKFLLQILEHGI